MFAFRRLYIIPQLAVLILFLLVTAAHADLRDDVRQSTRGFHDVTLTCKVVKANLSELKKIGKDFAKSYDFKTCKVHFKAPDKMKMEGKLGLVTGSMVINGDRKAFLIPSLHFKHKENIAGKPHMRQTEFDLGIFTDSLWSDYIVTDIEHMSGVEGPVYKITFVRSNAKKRPISCWVDARSFKMMKLENYKRNGSLKSRFIYSDHKLVDGIWVPTRVDVYNGNGKLAGSTEYENIAINAGIPDSEFSL